MENKTIYFGTLDNGVVTNTQIASIISLKEGIKVDHNDLDKIREYASTCKGITGEIERPSVHFLLKNNHKVQAIRIYHEIHNVGFAEATRIVNIMEEKIKNSKK